MAVDTYTYLRRLGYIGTTAQMLELYRRDTTATAFDINIPTTESVTYDGTGALISDTVDTATTVFTYNVDGSIATDTKGGVTRTYSYDGSGNLTGIA